MSGLCKAVLGLSLAVALLMLSVLPARAQAQDDSASVRKFVQEFYDWYAPLARQPSSVPAFVFALRKRPVAFSPSLAKALQDDADAQAKVTDDIVGIDWDPFLNTQDPEARYAVGEITRSGATYRVEVRAVRAGRERAKPDVVAEVAGAAGQWRFVNFHSPDGDDLLRDLAKLKKDREEHHE